MADYKKMYLKLVQATEEAIRQLIAAQQKCEEIYIESAEAEADDIDTYADKNAGRE